jgi:tryptophan-rich sensory protein
MYSSHSIQWKPFLISLLITLGIGGISGLIIQGQTGVYQSLNRPPLSPPSWLFPVVWTILYILMGIAAYLVYLSDPECRKPALTVYAVQLAVNFFWSPIFFNLEAYLLAFIWLVVLWILIVATIKLFYRCNKIAGWLLVPYLAWVTFAGYLSFNVWILNR